MILNFKFYLIFLDNDKKYLPKLPIILNSKCKTHLSTNQKSISIKSYKLSPVIFFPNFIKIWSFLLDLFLGKWLGCFDTMNFDIQSCCNYFITKLSLPKLLVFDYVSIAKSIWKINIKIVYLLWNLFLEPSFLFFNLDDTFMSRPVTFNILKSLLKKKRQIFSFLRRNS